MLVTEDMQIMALGMYERVCKCKGTVEPDAMHAALTAALSPGWRPIENAPTDGTIYFGCAPYAGIWLFGAGSFDGTEHVASNCFGEVFEPTHFMPLPAPPVQQKEGVS